MMYFIRSRLQRFIRDDTGSSTVEFVLWLPFLVVWLLSIVVFFDAFKSRGALISTNATISDIVSRRDFIDNGFMNMLQVMQSGLLPKTNGGGMRISSILYVIDPDIVDDPGTYSVVWSAVTGSLSIVLEDDDIPVSILPNMYSTETVLFVESVVDYTPLTRFAGITLTQLQSRAAISPRYDSVVAWVDP